MPKPAQRHSSGIYVGQTLTLQQQIANLRVLGDGHLLRNTTIGSALMSLAGFAWFVIADHQTEEVFALFFALCGALVCAVMTFGRPRFREAAAATHKGRREAASIVLLPGVDDDEHEKSLQGVLRPASPHLPRWKMVFVKADGWTPPEGELQVEAVYLSDLAWPALLLHPDGLLVPLGKPRRVD